MDVIQGHIRPRWFLPGEIALSGDPDVAHGVMAIFEGSVEIYRPLNPSGDVVLAELGPGACFGEFAAVSGMNGSAMARAVERSLIADIPAETFVELLHEYPGLSVKLLHSLIRRVQELDGRITGLEANGHHVNQVYLELLRVVL